MKKQTEQTHYVMREGVILNIDTRKLLLGQIVAVIFLQLFATPVWSQEDESQEQPSAADIANELANPNTALGFLAFQLDHIKYDGELPGADQQDAWKLNFQPNIPYPLGEGKNFFLRPLIPIVLDQPVFVGGSFEDRGVELGDIVIDAAVGKSFPSGLQLVGGIVATLPTATDDDLGLDQYLLGPEFFVGKTFDGGFIGALVSHQWDIAGEDDYRTSVTGGQYFYTINLENAWQIQPSRPGLTTTRPTVATS